MTMTQPDFSNVPSPTAMPHGAHASTEQIPAPEAEEITPQPQSAPPAFQTNDSAIVIDVPPVVPHNVVLAGHPYKVLPIKKLAIMDFSRRLSAAGSDTNKIFAELERVTLGLFGRQVGPQVLERMKDPEDVLDLEHIMELIKRLVEKSTGNPTS